jgi:ABC-2 type transport system permease protein
MNKLIRSEWIKFRSSTSNWVLLAAGVLGSLTVVLILVVLFGNTIGDSVPDTSLAARADVIGAGAFLSLIIVTVVGVRVFGNEWRTGTIQSAAIAAPIRPELYFAKGLLMAIVAFVYGILAAGFAAAAVFIGLGAKNYDVDFADPQVLRIVFGYVILCVLYAVVGVVVGSLFRSTALATALVIAVPSVVESAFSTLLPGNSGRYLPFAAAQSVLRVDPTPITPLQGGLIFAGFVAVLIVVGEVVFGRRDLGT